jgi:hypothetical protein
MAINKNHEFGELDGIKCAIVEKDALKDRVAFLKELLEFNGFTIVVVASPPHKAAPAPKPVTEGEPIQSVTSASPVPDIPETFTIGVTNVSFNPTNAIFGRQLKTKTGEIVTLAYWEQKETVSSEDVPYFEN